MSNCLLFEDGVLINNPTVSVLWDGLFSKVTANGKLIQYVTSCLPKNTLLVIPRSDGNINKIKNDGKYHDVDWDTQIQPYADYAKKQNKKFIIGTLSQKDEEPGYNYLYLPLDDEIFENGIIHFFNKNNLPSWKNRSSELIWRGGCSGVGNLESIRVRFVEKIYEYNNNTNVRLSLWWSYGKNIPNIYFKDRINYTEFLQNKIFFIVDGNCIASNHMYAFASGCVPFLVSDGICWFSNLIKPYIHYIPINYDLSNLIEQIEWVKNNDVEAEKIAMNAYSFAEIYFSGDYQKKYIKESIENICISNT